MTTNGKIIRIMTKKFIQTIKTYFKALKYEPKDLSLDFNAFKKSAYQSICYSKDNDSLKASILVAIIDFGYFSDKRPDSFASLEMYENDEDESLLMCFALSFIISTYNNVKHYQTMLLLYSCSKI